jgi:osmotically-inducible protein OsmY
MAEYWDRDRERGRRYRGEGYYGGYYGYGDPERERDDVRRGDERGFFDRAGDEVRSWFGDEEARRRRWRDERERGMEERDWWPGRQRERAEDERRGRGWRDDADRDWARQWGYVEGRGGRERDARGWGYSGGYGAGAGFTGGRGEWYRRGGDELPGWAERYGGRYFAGPGESRHESDLDRTMRRASMSGPYAGRGPRGYQRSDERIREDVCERMSECGELDASEIEVRVSNGEVTLLGSVSERHAKRLAEDLAEEVAGVRDVHNQIRVSQPGQDEQQQQRYRIA